MKKKKEIMELLNRKILSCYGGFILSRMDNHPWDYQEGMRCRLDELLLLYQYIMGISFIETCKYFEIDYELIQYKKENKKVGSEE